MKKELQFAPGVLFDKEKHEYFLGGINLSGVTGLIGKRMGRKIPEAWVGEAQSEGLHVHGTIEKWLNGEGWNSIHPGTMWIKSVLESQYDNPVEECHGEVLVSDQKQYASSVDIIGVRDQGLELFDIKRSFNRTYVSWQLSIYKYLIEKYAKRKVVSCACIAVRDKTVYPVFPYSVKDVEELLYGVQQ